MATIPALVTPGIRLTRNIENLPLAPEGYEHPPLWTEPKKSFAVANKYRDCHGMCFAVTMARVRKAYLDLTGVLVLSLNLRGQDYNISGTGTVNRQTIPNAWFGYGVGGAMAAKGLAELVPHPAVWNGKLKEGALIQYWWGDDPTLINKANQALAGHSIIFKSYLYDTAGNITGFTFHDYRGTDRIIIKENCGKVFFGANLKRRR